MKRALTKKSHSWWWDSHISRKNSKWLAQNLEKIDKNIKDMLKLIEEEGESFAKKAEMYYEKRPELINYVEEFYRMYRALAERYDQVTVDLRKNVKSELKSEGSDSCSDHVQDPSPPSSIHSAELTPEMEQEPNSNSRAAGFDFFLGSGGRSDLSNSSSSSTSLASDSEPDSEGNNEVNCVGVSSGLEQRVYELEDELRKVKEKLTMEEEKNYHVECGFNILILEEELSAAKKKLLTAEADIVDLKKKLDVTNVSLETKIIELDLEKKNASNLEEHVTMLQNEISGFKIEAETLKETAEKNIMDLEKKLEAANASLSTKIVELDLENKNVSNLEEHILMLQNEISDLKIEAETLMETSETNIMDLEKKLQAANVSLDTKIIELDLEKKNASNLEEHITMQQDEISGLKIEAETLKGAAETNIMDLEKKLEAANASLGTMIVELDLEKKNVSNLEEQIVMLQNEISDLKIEAETLKGTSEMDLEKKLQAANVSLDAKIIELGLEKKNVSKLEEYIVMLQNEISGLQIEAETLKGAAETSAKQFETELLSCAFAIDECKNDLENARERFGQEKCSLEAQILDLEVVNKGLKAEVENMLQKNLSLEVRFSEIELNMEKKVSKLEELIVMLQDEISGLKNEAETLKGAAETSAKQFEAELSSYAFTIEGCKNELKSARETFCQEKTSLKAQIVDLQGVNEGLKAQVEKMQQKNVLLEVRISELENVVQELNASTTGSADRILREMTAFEAATATLSHSNVALESMTTMLNYQMRQLEAARTTECDERNKLVSELNPNINALRLKVDMLIAEKEELASKRDSLVNDIKCRDDRIFQMDQHLHQLHLEHAKLMMEIEQTTTSNSELKSRLKELEEEVDRQKVMISDGAEGKREAIRQLCFSLEHYRDGYHHLRQLLQGHKRSAIAAR
ncbi:hypothetical protein Cni_G15577 [Canna indica]|uniref:NAB domain-containing protein n=1 Tax=Canna indica TaxID=4628 RepID=A0AAQ3KDW7_9LILI|nr:hypothetical protein Cni_G15577 [Canna indica]